MDLVGPGGDGSFTVAAAGRLFILSRAGALRPFARGPGGYSTALGPEPYITMAGNDRVAGTRCLFRSSMIFALQPGGRPGIILIGADGQARRFASLPATLTPTGITFDATGHFGHKLLVTASNHAETTVLAIDCAGGIRAILVGRAADPFLGALGGVRHRDVSRDCGARRAARDRPMLRSRIRF